MTTEENKPLDPPQESEAAAAQDLPKPKRGIGLGKKVVLILIVVTIAVLAIPEVRTPLIEKITGIMSEEVERIKVWKPSEDAVVPAGDIAAEQIENERAFENAEEIIASVEQSPVSETRAAPSIAETRPADAEAIDPAAAAQFLENTVMSLEIQVLKRQVEALTNALIQVDRNSRSAITQESDLIKRLAENDKRLRQIENLVRQMETGVQQVGSAVQQIERNKADAALVLELLARVDSTEQRLKRSSMEREKTAALLLTLFQLREAANSGQSFAVEQQAALALSNYNPRLVENLQRLSPVAGDGIWTRAALEQTFDTYADKAFLAVKGENAEHWWTKALNSLRSLVIIRRIDVDPDDNSIDAILARAGKAAKAGDLQTAVIHLKNLPPEGAEAFKEWVVAAERHILTQKAINELFANTLGILYAEKMKGG